MVYIYRLWPLESAEGNGIAENDESSAQRLAGGNGTGTAFADITKVGLGAEGLLNAHVLTFSDFQLSLCYGSLYCRGANAGSAPDGAHMPWAQTPGAPKA
jgi:hypothetical protein